MEQNREPRNSLQTYGQLIGKGYESIKWEEDSPFKNGVDKAGQPQVMNWEHTLLLYKKIKLNGLNT